MQNVAEFVSFLGYAGEHGEERDKFQKNRKTLFGLDTPYTAVVCEPEAKASVLEICANYAREACRLFVKPQPKQLSAREATVANAVNTFVRITDNHDAMLENVYQALTNAEVSGSFNVTGLSRLLVSPKGPYRSLLLALGVPDSVLDVVKQHQGDLSVLRGFGRQQFLKAVVVLALETNAFRSITAVNQDNEILGIVSLAKAVYTALISTSTSDRESLENVLADEELTEKFLGELLGDDRYRGKLSDAIRQEVGLRGVDALKGADPDVSAAMEKTLKELYTHSYIQMEQAAKKERQKLDKAGRKDERTIQEKLHMLKDPRLACEMTPTEVRDSLYIMCVDVPSLVMMTVHLCMDHKDYVKTSRTSGEEKTYEADTAPNKLFRQLRDKNSLLGDLISPPMEDDDGVDYAPSRKCHLAALHEAGHVDVEGDIARARAFLYLVGDRVDLNRLMAEIVKVEKGSSESDAGSAAGRIVRCLSRPRAKVLEKTADGYVPYGDLQGRERDSRDVVSNLCAALDSHESIVVLYRALTAMAKEAMVIPEDESAGLSEHSQQVNANINNARHMCEVLQCCMSTACHKKLFQVCLSERLVHPRQKVKRKLINTGPGSGPSAGSSSSQTAPMVIAARDVTKSQSDSAGISHTDPVVAAELTSNQTATSAVNEPVITADAETGNTAKLASTETLQSVLQERNTQKEAEIARLQEVLESTQKALAASKEATGKLRSLRSTSKAIEEQKKLQATLDAVTQDLKVSDYEVREKELEDVELKKLEGNLTAVRASRKRPRSGDEGDEGEELSSGVKRRATKTPTSD
ncbi:hypothetical protein [Parendozoicomonas sp. Alg238-R29]|uniref:hypothetical protein n=1 Tax=Parendozoicomonas sp. Alg238-R29 TaxID=2993446 RepID=UPI00248DA9B8|nr:hypothetical protein [Parendozoicomonas sp. Alg238-R29]